MFELSITSEKISSVFIRWWTKKSTPSYLKNARIIALSRTTSSCLTLGQVRTISILPEISKVFEQCILTKLEEEIENKNLISPFQRGFRKGKGCHTNLFDLFLLMSRARSASLKERRLDTTGFQVNYRFHIHRLY
jgi:hypothetical protein